MKKGFTLIELIIVLAIIVTLIGLSLSALTGLKETDYISGQGQNTLTAILRARNFAMNAESSSLSDNWIWGYIFFLQKNNGGTEYCIDKWYDIDPTSSPTSTSFVFPGTLSQSVDSGSALTFDPTQLQCGTSGNSTGNGYIAVDDKILDNRQDITYSINRSVAYIVFENLSGNTFLYDASGKYIANPGGDVTLTIKDTSGNQSTIYLYAANGEEPPHL